MNAKKFFYVMVGVFSLSIVSGAAMLYFANSMLQKRSSNVVDLKLQNTKLEAQLTAYQAAKKDVEKYSYLNDIIKSALPQDKDQARAVREIFLFAEQSGITLKSVQFATSTLGTATAAPTTATTPATGATTPAPAPKTVTQATAVKGLNGVYSLSTTVTPNADGKEKVVTYAQLINFLRLLETNRRAIQVSNIQITPLYQDGVSSISFSLTLNIFIKP